VVPVTFHILTEAKNFYNGDDAAEYTLKLL